MTHPQDWRTPSMAVGVVAMLLMWLGPRITQRVPSVILALVGSICMYGVLGLWDPSLQSLQGNTYVVGPLGDSSGGGGVENLLRGIASFVTGITRPWEAIVAMQAPPISSLLYPALTLAVLLSIDTLKTCVVLDTLTRSRHDSNQELIGQGLGNFFSAICSGMPGAGTMGATLVNISSGARSSNSGVVEGLTVCFAYLLLTPFLAWIPLAALGGILTVVGLRMIDLHSLALLRSRETRLDFVVIVTVAVVAQIFSLIAATCTGLVFAAVLFLTKQIGEHVVRRMTLGNQVFSKNKRLDRERYVLEKHGEQTVILELQGALFFGTANQLYSAVEPYLTQCRYLILDLRWVQSVDYSAVHILEQIRDRLAETGSELLLSDLPSQLPTGEDLREYFAHAGVLHADLNIRAFDELDEALEWVEEKWLVQEGLWPRSDRNFALRDFDVFSGRSEDTLSDLAACMESRVIAKGEKLFSFGDKSNEIYFILRGEMRIELQLPDGRWHHMASHYQGDFIGEMGFLDGCPRADFAIAATEVKVLSLSREKFDQLAENHRRLGSEFMVAIARVLASRLRQTGDELRVLSSA
jgi:SulP family sulfate permease